MSPPLRRDPGNGLCVTRQSRSFMIGLIPLATSLLVLATSALADGPPPIPTIETRAQLIAAEQEAAGASKTFVAREAHDEYDVIHYDISLDLDIPNQTIYGNVTLDAEIVAPNTSQLEIDLYECMTVDQVMVGGNPAFYLHADRILTVTLDGTYQTGEDVQVSCTYHGTPSLPGQPLPFRWNLQNGVPMVLSYSEPYGAPAWWMCKDDPKDKATYTIHLTVPDSLTAVSNGLLDSVVDNLNGTATYDWSTAYPMSTYLFSIAVTDFESWTEPYTALDEVTTMDVTYWTYPADLADAQVSWDRNIEMMDYCASIFGEYPFLDEKYGIAEFAHPGAMEHQTCTSMGSNWIDGTHSNDFVVIHELAHSWVGDMITMTEWSHAWCKEGFATYCEALWFEHQYGENYYHSYMGSLNGIGYADFQLFEIEPPLHAAIYYKGAWVLHMLRHVIGNQAFFDAIYAYTNEPAFRYAVADTDDMCALFEEVTETELGWFFDQWIYQPGAPEYETAWWADETADGYDVTLAINQIQDVGPIFKMPIDIRINTFSGEENFVVWDSLETQTFRFTVESQPVVVRTDPNSWILRRVTPAGVPASDQVLPTALLKNHPNPFQAATAIDFHLETDARITIDLFDVTGRRVVRLLDDPRASGPGRVVWNGMNALGQPVAPGIYYATLSVDGLLISRPLHLIR